MAGRRARTVPRREQPRGRSPAGRRPPGARSARARPLGRPDGEAAVRARRPTRLTVVRTHCANNTRQHFT